MCLFQTTLIGSGSSAGIEVPPEVIDELGAGKRPPVKVTLAGYTFPSTVAVMGGRFLIAVNAETRKRTGLRAGDRAGVDAGSLSPGNRLDSPRRAEPSGAHSRRA